MDLPNIWELVTIVSSYICVSLFFRRIYKYDFDHYVGLTNLESTTANNKHIKQPLTGTRGRVPNIGSPAC